MKTSCLLPRKGMVCRCHLGWKIKCSSQWLIPSYRFDFQGLSQWEKPFSHGIFIWKYICLENTCDNRKKKHGIILGRQSGIEATHTHKIPLLAVIKEWTGWKGLLETTLEDVSAVPLHDWPLHAQPLHAPGERKTETPGLREAFHLSQLLTVAALWESPKNGLSWVDLTVKKKVISCWYGQQH